MITNIKKIGNSKGVIIPPAFLAQFNLDKVSDINIEINPEGILITPVVNPRENWEAAFQEAFENGDLPESDYFAGMKNEFDETEWTW